MNSKVADRGGARAGRGSPERGWRTGVDFAEGAGEMVLVQNLFGGNVDLLGFHGRSPGCIGRSEIYHSTNLAAALFIFG